MYRKMRKQKSYSTFWSSYKGHVKGLLAGTALGGMAGVAVGLALLPIAGPVALIACAAAGIIYGAEQVGSIGASSASRAAGLAEKHARFLAPENANDPLKAADDKLMADGRGHHYEFPPERDNGKIFNLKSGLAGSAIGAASGALIGATHLIAELPVVAALGMATPVTAAVVMGVCGLTFGVERGLFKSVFNKVSSLMDGKTDTHDVGREQAAGKSNGQLLEERVHRQADIHHLQAGYDEKIFLGGVKGWFKGAMGGSAVGALVGTTAGIVALAVMAVVAPHVATAAVVVGAFASAGAILGLKTFAEVGKEAGTESTSRAIDDEYERGKVLRERGIATPAVQTEKKPGFNLGVAVAMAVVGAAVGFALAPFIAGTAIGLAIAPVVAGAAISSKVVLASCVMGGVVGAASGLSDGIVKTVIGASTALYNKTYSGHHHDEPQPSVPLIQNTKVQPHYTVTSEEAANLNSKLLEAKNERNFSDTIMARGQVSPSFSHPRL